MPTFASFCFACFFLSLSLYLSVLAQFLALQKVRRARVVWWCVWHTTQASFSTFFLGWRRAEEEEEGRAFSAGPLFRLFFLWRVCVCVNQWGGGPAQKLVAEYFLNSEGPPRKVMESCPLARSGRGGARLVSSKTPALP